MRDDPTSREITDRRFKCVSLRLGEAKTYQCLYKKRSIGLQSDLWIGA